MAATGFMKSSTIVAGVVGEGVKESIVVVAVVAVAFGEIVERAGGVAAEAIGEIAVEEKVVDVVVDVDGADSEATVGVAMELNRQVALTPHYLCYWLVCASGLRACAVLLLRCKREKR